MSLSVPILIAGLRDLGVGTDTRIYTGYYWGEASHCSLSALFDDSADFEGIDKGYLLLNMFCHLFSDDVWVILFVSSVITFFFVFLGVEKLKHRYDFKYWIFAFYFLFIYYNQTFNYMRQFCALAMVFCAFGCYLKKEYYACLILLLFAYFFHSSSLVFLLIPAMYLLAGAKSKTLRLSIEWGIVVFFICILFFFWKILAIAVDLGLVLSVYGDRYGNGTEYEPGQIDYSNILLYIVNFVFIIYAGFKKILNRMDYNFVLMLHIVYGLTYSLMTISTYLFRISYYFGIVEMAYMVIILSSKKFPKLFSLSYYIILVICWYYYFIYHNSCETYPYKSFILGIN